MSKPRILVIDIETSAMVVDVFGLRDQNIGLNQIQKDWRIISFAAKWLGSDKVTHMDTRKLPERALLKVIWHMFDMADYVVGQNSISFDTKKINARLIVHGFKPPSGYRQIDTVRLARKHFGFTSNKLEYLSKNLNEKFKKLDHNEFPGYALWAAVRDGNKRAWDVMKQYNIFDVLATEELYNILLPWEPSINFNVHTEILVNKCRCGSYKLTKNGCRYTGVGKYQSYRCMSCGGITHSKVNLLTKSKRDSLRKVG